MRFTPHALKDIEKAVIQVLYGEGIPPEEAARLAEEVLEKLGAK